MAIKVLVLFLCLKSVLSDSVLNVFDSYDDFIGSGDNSTEFLLSTNHTSAKEDSLYTTNPTVVNSPDTTITSTRLPTLETTTTSTSAPSGSSATTLAIITEENLFTTSVEPSKQTTIGSTPGYYSTTELSTDHSDASESFSSSSSIVLSSTIPSTSLTTTESTPLTTQPELSTSTSSPSSGSTSTTSPSSPSSGGDKFRLFYILLAIFGCLILIMVAAVLYCLRKRRSRRLLLENSGTESTGKIVPIVWVASTTSGLK